MILEAQSKQRPQPSWWAAERESTSEVESFLESAYFCLETFSCFGVLFKNEMITSSCDGLYVKRRNLKKKKKKKNCLSKRPAQIWNVAFSTCNISLPTVS